MPIIRRPLFQLRPIHDWRKRLKSVQSSFFQAGLALNEVTGYKAVEERKEAVLLKDKQLDLVKNAFREAKSHYEALIEARRRMQKDLDALKDRKSTLEDIHLLTDLYKKQLGLEVEEKDAKVKYKNATDDFERIQIEYMTEMRERYVEEQMYSDKIRRASTWWTWVRRAFLQNRVLLPLNCLSFWSFNWL
jgi:sensitive to high expression protein 9